MVLMKLNRIPKWTIELDQRISLERTTAVKTICFGHIDQTSFETA
jgi:hypothetical protein